MTDPYSLHPETCDPLALSGIDLAELIAERNEVPENYNMDFLSDVQVALDTALEKHNACGPHWYQGNGARPFIPENWNDIK